MVVIQMFRLEDFMEEAEALGMIARVEGTVRRESASSSIPGLYDEVAEVYARAWSSVTEESYTLMLPVGRVRMLHEKTFDAEDNSLELLEARLRAAEEAVRDHLMAHGINVRRGLIYVGDAKPVQGRWDLLGEILAAVTVGGDDADNADDDRG